MRHDLIGISLLLITLDASAVEAQDGSGAQKPDGSLSQVLRVGQNVNLRNADGDTTRGRVVAVTDDQVVLRSTRRFFRRDTNELFSADAIRTIDAIDSTWNGAVIGAFSGVAVLWWLVEHPPEFNDERVAFFILPMPLWGAVVGGVIDGLLNRRIWDRPTPTVTFAPVLGERRIGLSTRVRF
jgi:hypothetical protein